MADACGVPDASEALLRAWAAASAAGDADAVRASFWDTAFSLPIIPRVAGGGGASATPVSLLGRGAFGSVWLASVPGKELPVAVKQMDAAALVRDGQAFRAARELRALGLLSNSHNGRLGGARFVAALRGAGASACGRWLYIVEEACPAGTLESALREGGAGVGVVAARAHAACILAALAACARAGIAHRDVRPANVCIGTDGLVRLIDFGFATSVGGVDGSLGVPHLSMRSTMPLPAAALAAIAALGPCCICPDCFPSISTGAPPKRGRDRAGCRTHDLHAFHTSGESAVHAARLAVRDVSFAPSEHAQDVRGTSCPAGGSPRARATSFVGSVAHMAPEVSRAEEVVRGSEESRAGEGGTGGDHDARADVWSFGITLLELIGVALPADPLAGDSLLQRNRPAPVLPSDVLSAWPALSALLECVFEPNAAARPTAEELLRHAAFSEPLIGGGGGYWSRAINVEDLFSGGDLPPVAQVNNAVDIAMVSREPASACAWGADSFYFADETVRVASDAGELDEGLAEEFRSGGWAF